MVEKVMKVNVMKLIFNSYALTEEATAFALTNDTNTVTNINLEVYGKPESK